MNRFIIKNFSKCQISYKSSFDRFLVTEDVGREMVLLQVFIFFMQ